MVELLADLPSTLVGFRASGEVTAEDYKNIVFPAVDAVAESTGKINFLLLLDTDIQNYTAGAGLNDILVGFKHFNKWHKIAIVSDQEGLNKLTNGISGFIPGEARGFSKSQLEEAKNWLLS
ncbi:STAS/SEC14 domain-containing protein [Rubrolithibacter danxiaensis]|uniref:STAS/SEC14 domain-containing protein n=1 Tax=Rubrolithibacter danxiaensis TaxID=3390805 RepID=UPI003BF7F666